MNIHDCNFYGVKWDAKSAEAVNIVAKALLNITELFKAQNTQFVAMLKVVPDESASPAEAVDETKEGENDER